MSNTRTILETFTESSLPDLDVVVRGALELCSEVELPAIPHRFSRPLIIGSGNAFVTGRVIFNGVYAGYATESSVEKALLHKREYDGTVLISASGGKHAVRIASKLKDHSLPCMLFTNNERAPARKYIEDEFVVLFPKNREPYTYNTSTYLSMILSSTKEDPSAIRMYCEKVGEQFDTLDMRAYSAFTVILPARFELLREMVRTKFEELFGPMICGRVYTEEEVKHAKTVTTSPHECFIALGVENSWYGSKEQRVSVAIGEQAGYGMLMAICYTIIGVIQRQHPPYFKNNIVEYTDKASELFNQTITPIVE